MGELKDINLANKAMTKPDGVFKSGTSAGDKGPSAVSSVRLVAPVVSDSALCGLRMRQASLSITN